MFINTLWMHTSNHRLNYGKDICSRVSCYVTCSCQSRLTINDILDNAIDLVFKTLHPSPWELLPLLTWLLRCLPGAGEAFHSWQRSWGRRLGIRKGRIEPQESPRIFSSIYPPKTRVCLLYCFVLSPLTLLGAVPYHHLTLSVKELTYSSN